MQKRSTKFYRKNEAEIMKRLGFKPTKNSGATWIDKCDGQSDHFICELKSTDHSSFTVKQEYLHTLEAHAIEAHKIPVFAFNFLNTDEVWLSIKESDIEAIRTITGISILEELKEEIILKKPQTKEEKNNYEFFIKSIDKVLDKCYYKGEKRKGGLKSSTSCHILQNSSSSCNIDIINNTDVITNNSIVKQNNTNNVLLEVNKHKAKQSIEARKLFLKEKQKEQEQYETMQKERNKNRRRTITQNRKGN